MLVIKPAQMDVFQRQSEQAFLERLRRFHAERHPAFLPRFPPDVQTAILTGMMERAKARGATWQSSIALFCDLMEAVSPRFDRDPDIMQAMGPSDRHTDDRLDRLTGAVAPPVWERLARERDDLPLYAPAGLDEAPLAQRLAAALPLVLWDTVAAPRAPEVAEGAIALATHFGFDGLDDAGLAIAAWRALYGAGWRDGTLPWVRDVVEPARPARERLALLRLRIMLDHGRRV